MHSEANEGHPDPMIDIRTPGSGLPASSTTRPVTSPNRRGTGRSSGASTTVSTSAVTATDACQYAWLGDTLTVPAVVVGPPARPTGMSPVV